MNNRTSTERWLACGPTKSAPPKTKLALALEALSAIADAENAGESYPGDGWRLAHAKLCGFARASIANIARIDGDA